MKLKVNNFGPVRGKQDYEIDLAKGFTIVTGRNGLGKTYLGYIVYGFIKHIRAFDFSRESIRSLFIFNEKQEESGFSNLHSVEISKEDLISVLTEIITEFKQNFYLKLGIERSVFDSIFAELELLPSSIENRYNAMISGIKKEEAFFSKGSVVYYRVNNSRVVVLVSLDDYSEFKSAFLSFFLRDVIEIFMFKLTSFYPCYIPVERNSIFTFSKELSLKRSDLIDQMQEALLSNKKVGFENILRKNSKRYPEVIEDALKDAQDLNQYIKGEANEVYVGLANQIETQILQGNLSIDSNGQVEFRPQSQKKNSVPVHLSASFIKTISSVILFLKHKAQKGDFLMIDEPEMNLHPDMQIAFARILAKISNAGIRVWLSTHSDYMIAEFNNMCLVNKLRQSSDSKYVEEIGYSEGEYLNTNDMQALYFDDQAAKTQVKIKSLKITEQGIDVASIDNTLSALNERTNRLEEWFENLEG